MRVGMKDIDLRIADALKERLLTNPREFLKDHIYWGGMSRFQVKGLDFAHGLAGLGIKRKREPNRDELAAFRNRKLRQDRQIIWGLGSALIPVAAGAISASAATHLGMDNASFVVGLGAWCATFFPGLYFARNAGSDHQFKRYISPEELRAATPLLQLSRSERIYCDILILLASMDIDASSESNVRETLRQLNDLLSSSRILQSRRHSLLSVQSAHQVEELESEAEKLRQQELVSTDPSAKISLHQSLEMCLTRLENARYFRSGIDRIVMQEEALLQTLASALSALARMQLTPETQSAEVAEHISDTIAEMNRQTYSVEQAVEEVIQLRGE